MKSLIAAIALALMATAVTGAEAQPAAGAATRAGKWAEINGVYLRYEFSGSGTKTAVLIHDPGLNLEEWDEIVPHLPQGWRVLRYDLRGMGLSEKIRRTSTVEQQLGDLEGLLGALNIRGPVTLIGSTSSAALALKYAGLHPERVKAVVAMNPNTKLNITRPPLNPSLGGGRDMREVMEKQGVREFMRTELDWLYPPEIRTPERMARFWGSQVAQDPAERALYMRIQNSSVDMVAELPRVKCPTLVIAGVMNSSYTLDEWRSIAEAIPDSRLETIRAGHYIPLQAPELALPSILAFLNSHG